MSTNETIDSLMQSTANRNLVKWAAGHCITCPVCERILDCRSTVVAGRHTGEQCVVCGTCFDKQPDLFAYSEVVDGRKLWAPVTAAPKRESKTKSRYTFCQRIERGLAAAGWTRDYSDRSRYSAWVKAGEGYKLFTGPSGALRKGRCASDSYSIGDPCSIRGRYAELLVAGERELEVERLARK